MCCDPGGATVDDPKTERLEDCPECGCEAVTSDGVNYNSTDVCGYSPLQCERCGWRPCDDSC